MNVGENGGLSQISDLFGGIIQEEQLWNSAEYIALGESIE